MNQSQSKRKNQIWLTVFTIVPAVLFPKIANTLNIETWSIVYSVATAAVGALVGYSIYHLTRRRSQLMKGMAIATLFIGPLVILFLLSKKQSDEEIVKRDWPKQKIGSVKFETPTQLELQSIETPPEITDAYQKFEFYSDGKTDRFIFFMNTVLKTDTIALLDSFSGALDNMLEKRGATDFEFVEPRMHDNQIATRFKYTINGKKVDGFGFMLKNGPSIQALWLIPVERTFSPEFINKVENSLNAPY